MKVLVLSDFFPPEVIGGAELIASRTTAALARRGHAVVVVTTSPDARLVERRVQGGCTVITLPLRVPARLRFWLDPYRPAAVRWVRQILDSEQPEVVHAHNLHMQLSFACLAAARRAARRVFLTAHDPLLVHYDKFIEAVDPSDQSDRPSVRNRVRLADQLRAARLRFSPFRGPFLRHYARHATRIFSVSDALGRILIASGIQNVTTMHNGIDAAVFRSDAAEAKRTRELLDAGDRPIILFAGRSTQPKGIGMLRQAFTALGDHPRRPILLIAAPGIAGALVREGSSVIRASFAPAEMPAVYAASDFVVVPSLYSDPFPTVNLEAGAAARPVVGTCFGGTPEVVLDGETGIIVNPFNRDALASAMRRLLDRPEEAAAMGERARLRIAKHFTLDQHLDALLAWYRGEAVAAHNNSLVS